MFERTLCGPGLSECDEISVFLLLPRRETNSKQVCSHQGKTEERQRTKRERIVLILLSRAFRRRTENAQIIAKTGIFPQ